jgi:hypothetical protein
MVEDCCWLEDRSCLLVLSNRLDTAGSVVVDSIGRVDFVVEDMNLQHLPLNHQDIALFVVVYCIAH